MLTARWSKWDKSRYFDIKTLMFDVFDEGALIATLAFDKNAKSANNFN